MRDRAKRLDGLRRFTRDDAKIKRRGQFFWIMSRAKLRVKFVCACDVEPFFMESARMLGPADKGPDLRYARQMCCVEAADRSTTDDADAFHPASISPNIPSFGGLVPEQSRDILARGTLMFDADRIGEFALAGALHGVEDRVARIVGVADDHSAGIQGVL